MYVLIYLSVCLTFELLYFTLFYTNHSSNKIYQNFLPNFTLIYLKMLSNLTVTDLQVKLTSTFSQPLIYPLFTLLLIHLDAVIFYAQVSLRRRTMMILILILTIPLVAIRISVFLLCSTLGSALTSLQPCGSCPIVRSS